MILVRLAYSAAVMAIVLWLLETGRPVGGLLIVPLAAVRLRHEAESGRLVKRVRQTVKL
jgi:hypothetical protein